jgi:hypothetical protein
MPDSTLSITYDDLQAEVGEFLHYGPDASSWSAEETKRVDRIIQAGVRQFYYPPAMEGIELGYEWSFMRPGATLVTVAGTRTYDLPDDFSKVVGEMYYAVDVFNRAIVEVPIGRIDELLQANDDSDFPRFFAVRFKASTGATGQKHEVLFWPKPNDAFTLSYRYDAYAGKIDQLNYRNPLGGMKYGECIIESCLSVAERRGNDEAGIHEQQFQRLLMAAVAMDRRNSAQRYGDMAGGERGGIPSNRHNCYQTFYPITYKGETW